MTLMIYRKQFNLGSRILSREVSKEVEGDLSYGGTAAPITLPVANAITGAHFTNDADGTATATLAAEHTLVDGVADLYWSGGLRRGCTVDVTADSVSISGGAGDALPPTGTPCSIANQVAVSPLAIRGSSANGVGLDANVRCSVDFQDAGSATVRHVELSGTDMDTWTDAEAENPYDGNDIVKAMASCGDTATAASLQILVGQDVTA